MAAPAQQESGPSSGWSLAEIAEVRVRGTDVPQPRDTEEELVFSAWEVYRYVLARARREGRPSKKNDQEGWMWSGDIKTIYHTLWPANSSPMPQSGLAFDESRRIINAWLLRHGNVAIVQRGREERRMGNKLMETARPSVWWISEEFSGTPEGVELPDTSANPNSALPSTELTLLRDAPPPPEPAVPEPVREPGPAPAPERPAPEPASEPERDDWRCPYPSLCRDISLMSRDQLGEHLRTVHTFRSRMVLDIAFGMADKERGRQPLPQSPPPVLKAAAPPEVPVPVPVPSSQHGVVSAQARVFATEVARLEAELRSAQEENVRLRTQLAEKPPPVLLADGEVERIVSAVRQLLE